MADGHMQERGPCPSQADHLGKSGIPEKKGEVWMKGALDPDLLGSNPSMLPTSE